MKPSEMIPILKTSFTQNWPSLVLGTPGIGKSEIIENVTNELGYNLLVTHPVVDDPTDYKGLPAIVNGRAEFMPYGNLNRMIDIENKIDKGLVVFFDDIGQAPNSCQAAVMQLLLNRAINGKPISDKVRFVAASNGRKDSAGVTGIITPLINRFRSVIDLEVSVDDWCKWALENGVPLELIAFIQMRPDHLCKFDPKAGKDLKPFATPRSIKFLGDWLNQKVNDVTVWKTCVGEGFAAEFHGFFQIYQRVGNLIPQIILNPKKAPIQDKPDEHYAVCAALAYKATDTNIDAIAEYMERFKNAEYRTFTWKCAITRDKKLAHTAAFQNYSVKHADELG